MSFLDFLYTYGTQLSAIAASITFIFGVYKFIVERKEAHFWKEFEVYHKLVKELVEPSSKNDSLFIDRQAAIIFELRNFKRYYPYSLRMLKGLQEKWSKDPNQFPRLLEEVSLTIDYLKHKTK